MVFMLLQPKEWKEYKKHQSLMMMVKHHVNILMNQPNTVDLQKFYYLTSDGHKRDDATDTGVEMDDIVMVHRVNGMKASKMVTDTKGFKQARGASAAQRVVEGVKEYKLPASAIPMDAISALVGGL